MHRGWQIVFLVAVLSGLTACLTWPDSVVISKQPDKVLFERAMSAMERNRLDVATLTLQTLVTPIQILTTPRKRE